MMTDTSLSVFLRMQSFLVIFILEAQCGTVAMMLGIRSFSVHLTTKLLARG